MSTASVGALDRIIGQCQRFRQPDVKPLLRAWEKRIVEDNRRGILAGLDGLGQPLAAVTYRPEESKDRKWTRGDQAAHKGRSAHTGRFEESSYNNLSPRQYRQLSGPPLAPRGLQSRVITNLYTGQGYDSSRGVFYAVGAWRDVVSRDGVPFLLAHFTGASCGRGHRIKLKVRDLRGIRPQGQQECLDDLEAWGVAHVKATFI